MMVADGRRDIAAEAFAQGFDNIAIGCEFSPALSAEMIFIGSFGPRAGLRGADSR